MNQLKAVKKEYFIYTGIYFVIFTIIIFLTFTNPKPAIIGLFFGCMVSFLNFLDLSNSLEKACFMTPEKARIYTGIRYAIRYILTGVVVAVSIKAPNINVIGTVIGLLSIKLVIFTKQLKK